mgnify:CR=1 FL=1
MNEDKDFRQELCDYIAEHHCTLQEVIDKVKATSSFGHSLTEEKALQLQADLNRYNDDKTSKVCVLMGIDEGGYSWHVWGPTIDLKRTQSEELAEIFAKYMNNIQRDTFELKLKDLDPWWQFKKSTT